MRKQVFQTLTELHMWVIHGLRGRSIYNGPV